jgi:hypothetical protein
LELLFRGLIWSCYFATFKVLYDDGEQEILDLGVERWQLTTKKQGLVKVGSSCPMDGFVPFPNIMAFTGSHVLISHILSQ